jgi:hypothetical protein
VKLAVRRIGRGEPSRLPIRYEVALVAAAHGTSPEDVRDWPADDYHDALAMLPLTLLKP